MDKPRICEVLGVEVGETFSVDGSEFQWYVSKDGFVVAGNERDLFTRNFMSDGLLMQIINYPWLVIKEPQFTQDEMVVLRLLKKGGFIKLSMNDDVCICAKKILNEKFYFPKEILPSFKTDYEIDLNKMSLE